LKYSANCYPAKLACSRPFFDRGGSSFISTDFASSSFENLVEPQYVEAKVKKPVF
jgi:hypothetical protein